MPRAVEIATERQKNLTGINCINPPNDVENVGCDTQSRHTKLTHVVFKLGEVRETELKELSLF